MFWGGLYPFDSNSCFIRVSGVDSCRIMEAENARGKQTLEKFLRQPKLQMPQGERIGLNQLNNRWFSQFSDSIVRELMFLKLGDSIPKIVGKQRLYYRDMARKSQIIQLYNTWKKR